MSTKKILVLHKDHISWLNDLEFIQDELKCFQDELAYLAAKSFASEEQSKVNTMREEIYEHFKNIDELRYTIHLHEVYLSEEAAKGRNLDFDHCSEEENLTAFKQTFEAFKLKARNYIKQLLHNFHESEGVL